MTAGPARPFVSVKFTAVGRTYSFLIPELALDQEPSEMAALQPGAEVVVQTEAGPAFGTVTRTITPLAARRAPVSEDAKVIRRATKDDVVARLKHQHREQEAQRICLLKIRERGLD